MTRVWNITDGGQPGVTAHSRMVLGKMLKPGHYLKVKKSRLVGASKIQQDVGAKLLFVGDLPPAWYSQKKKPPRAKVEGRLVEENGRAVGKKVKVVSGHAVTANPVEPKPVEDPELEAPEPAPEEAKIEETPAEETSEESPEETTRFGSRRRKRT